MFCLISLLILALIGVSFREVDWTAEARREREKRANNASNGRDYGRSKMIDAAMKIAEERSKNRSRRSR